jgi:hypothetical protein
MTKSQFKLAMIGIAIVALLAAAYVAMVFFAGQPCDDLGQRMFGDCSQIG